MNYTQSSYNASQSRRVRNQKKQAIRQSLLALVIAIFLLVAFVFWALPMLLQMGLGGESIDFGVSDTIPPQVPQLEAPVVATNSANLNIAGYGESKSVVKVLLNGQQNQEVVVDEQGAFNSLINLENGENIITVFGVDDAGNESAQSQHYVVIFDNEKPEIKLDSLTDGQHFEQRQNQLLQIHGTTEANAVVYVDGRMVRANAEGKFSTSKQLVEGDNNIEFRVVDAAGNENETKLLVTFRL